MSVKCSSVQPFSVSQLCRALSARSWAWVRCAIPPSNSAPTLCSRHPVSNRCQRSAISPTRIWHVGDGSRASRKRQRIHDSIGDSANTSARGISHLSRMTSRSPACSIDAAASSSRLHVRLARARSKIARPSIGAVRRTTSQAVRAGGVHQIPLTSTASSVPRTEGWTCSPGLLRLSTSGGPRKCRRSSAWISKPQSAAALV